MTYIVAQSPNLPPHSIEAEQAVLGAIFVEPLAYNEASLIIKSPDMFYRTLHCDIYRAMQELASDAKEIDWVSCLDKMKVMGTAHDPDAVHNYLVEVSHAVPSANGIENYAGTVRDHWIRRSVINLGGEMREIAARPTETPNHILGIARTAIDEIQDGCVVNEPIEIKVAMDHCAQDSRAGGIVGEETGIKALDTITSGWRGGQLIVVGARPGCGKSAFVTQVAEFHQARKSNVFLASLEMSHREISERLVAMRANVDSRKYRNWTLSDAHKELAVKAEQSFSGHLWLDDTASLSADEIAAKARRLHSKHWLKLVIVDYLQLIRAGDVDRHLQIGQITRRLKILARELNVPVVAASQLNRESAKEKRPPTLADLRESGNIEQDADQVLLIHWPQEGDLGDVARVEIHVAKNRGGPTGAVELEYKKAQTKFVEATGGSCFAAAF